MERQNELKHNQTTEQPAVRTTIVGARPPGPGKGVGSVPRGIEVLVKKAAVDPEFKTLLMAKRSAAADAIGLKLSDAEAAMLDSVPVAQLGAIIASTTVSPKLRPAFLGRAAAVMLAALGVGLVGCGDDDSTGPEVRGTRPDEPEVSKYKGTKEIERGPSVTDDRTAEAEKNTISGYVFDEGGFPISGVRITVMGINYSTVSDFDGYFLIKDVPDGKYDLKASRVGYREQVINAVTVGGITGSVVSFALKEWDFKDIGTTGSRPDLPKTGD